MSKSDIKITSPSLSMKMVKNQNKKITFAELVGNRSDDIIAMYYLQHTKEIFKCDDPDVKNPTLYRFDPEYKYYKKVPLMIAANLIVDELVADLSGAMFQKKYAAHQKDIGKMITKLGSKSTKINVAITVASRVADEKFKDMVNQDKHLFHFRNGVMDLRTGKFRERTPEDLVTKVLDYDYQSKRDIKKMQDVLKIYCNICNDEAETLDLILRFLGYCLTGETNEQLGLMLIGPKASNGKSKSLKIFKKCFPIYCKDINNRTFNKDFSKIHKTYAELGINRLIFIEELDCDMLSTQEIKKFLDGLMIEDNEILFKTTGIVYLYCKLIICSNKIPVFPNDRGMMRRFLCAFLKNQFVNEEDYNNLEDKTGYYVRDKYIENRFDDVDMKNALFHILLPYAIEFYQKGVKFDKKFENEWKDICDENDKMKAFIESKFIQTNSDNDRISKQDFKDSYNSYLGNAKAKQLEWPAILTEIKRLGLKYDRLKRAGNGRGCILGLREKDDDDLGVDEKKEEETDNKADFNKIKNIDRFAYELAKRLIGKNKVKKIEPDQEEEQHIEELADQIQKEKKTESLFNLIDLGFDRIMSKAETDLDEWLEKRRQENEEVDPEEPVYRAELEACKSIHEIQVYMQDFGWPEVKEYNIKEAFKKKLDELVKMGFFGELVNEDKPAKEETTQDINAILTAKQPSQPDAWIDDVDFIEDAVEV